MLRKIIERLVGSLSDSEWSSTCKIADNYLKARIGCKYKSNLEHVLILCIGIATSIKKGTIHGGVA